MSTTTTDHLMDWPKQRTFEKKYFFRAQPFFRPIPVACASTCISHVTDLVLTNAFFFRPHSCWSHRCHASKTHPYVLVRGSFTSWLPQTLSTTTGFHRHAFSQPQIFLHDTLLFASFLIDLLSLKTRPTPLRSALSSSPPLLLLRSPTTQDFPW